jgi:SAM-dependent methyltransferase
MAYTALDRFVAHWRFRAALPNLLGHSTVCDVGCGLDAAFLAYAGSRIQWGVGLDDQVQASADPRRPVIRADITRGMPFLDSRFDHVVMLAVLEHLPAPEPLLAEIFRVLSPGGSLILTWPQPFVDPLLNLLHRFRMVSSEMESQKHQQRIPLPRLLNMLSRIGFREFFHRRFEFGLNNLLVASKPASTSTPSPRRH